MNYLKHWKELLWMLLAWQITAFFILAITGFDTAVGELVALGLVYGQQILSELTAIRKQLNDLEFDLKDQAKATSRTEDAVYRLHNIE